VEKSPDDIVVVGGYRTPFSKYGGALKEWGSYAVGAYLLPRALERLGVDPAKADLLVCATSVQPEVANHLSIIARQTIIKAGLPLSLPSFTVDQASCSGLTAVQLGRQAIASGEADVVVVLGTEAMGNAAFIAPPRLRWGTRGDIVLRDPIFPMRAPMGPEGPIGLVDREAEAFGVARKDADRWALGSQMKYEQARKSGLIAEAIIPIELADGSTFVEDEAPKAWSTMEKLEALKPVFGSTTVTAGNSPGLETGAAVLVLMRRSAAESLSRQPIARVLASATISGELEAPLVQGARATRLLLERAKVSIDSISTFEIEEDFAVVVPISASYFDRELHQPAKTTLERTNPNGGAVTMGHPVATGGVRIALELAHHLHKHRGLGVAAISGGLSQGAAVLMAAE
jgi:acetyl-CoA C-acetyltransferase